MISAQQSQSLRAFKMLILHGQMDAQTDFSLVWLRDVNTQVAVYPCPACAIGVPTSVVTMIEIAITIISNIV